MEVTIKINGQTLSVKISVEVYECLDRANHKEENLTHEKRRHWDIREFDEYIIATEGRPPYQETPEEYVCRKETRDELLSVLESCTEAQLRLVHACCNYDGGNCLALDDGDECVCVQSISYSLFAVGFGALFVPGSNRAKYCPECAGRISE